MCVTLDGGRGVYFMGQAKSGLDPHTTLSFPILGRALVVDVLSEYLILQDLAGPRSLHKREASVRSEERGGGRAETTPR